VIDFNLFKSQKRLYYWGLAAYDKSYSLKIDHRYQAGAGLGWNLIRKPSFVLVLTDGPLYESGLLFDTLAYTTFRNSFRIKYRVVFYKIINLEGVSFLQQSLDDAEDYILKSDHTLSVKLQKYLSLTASLSYNKFNLTKKENLFSTFGLSFERSF
jgi:hypothetical protein